MLFVKSYVIVK